MYDIKCKLIELFLYNLYVVVVCKYICGAFSGQELLTCQQWDKVCILCIFRIQNTVFVFKDILSHNMCYLYLNKFFAQYFVILF